MTISSLLKERMDALGISKEKLVEDSMVESSVVEGLLTGELSVQEVDSTDMEFISSVLMCSVEYFINEEVRKQDLVYVAGTSDIKANTVMAQLQGFANDFAFLKEIHTEVYSNGKEDCFENS